MSENFSHEWVDVESFEQAAAQLSAFEKEWAMYQTINRIASITYDGRAEQNELLRKREKDKLSQGAKRTRLIRSAPHSTELLFEKLEPRLVGM